MTYTEQITELSGLLNRRAITPFDFNRRKHQINVKIWAGKGIKHSCGEHCL